MLTGLGWACEIIDLAGDEVGDDGRTLVEDLELWRQDPVECVTELIGNPAFKEYISYVPEHVYTDDAGQDRIYDEMWTGVTIFFPCSIFVTICSITFFHFLFELSFVSFA